MVRKLLWILVLGSSIWGSFLVIPLYITYWKIQQSFQSLVSKNVHEDRATILQDLPKIFRINFVDREDFPDEFYKNLRIVADGKHAMIESRYRVTVWALGKPAEDAMLDPTSAEGLDKLRLNASFVLTFHPHAESP